MIWSYKYFGKCIAGHGSFLKPQYWSKWISKLRIRKQLLRKTNRYIKIKKIKKCFESIEYYPSEIAMQWSKVMGISQQTLSERNIYWTYLTSKLNIKGRTLFTPQTCWHLIISQTLCILQMKLSILLTKRGNLCKKKKKIIVKEKFVFAWFSVVNPLPGMHYEANWPCFITWKPHFNEISCNLSQNNFNPAGHLQNIPKRLRKNIKKKKNAKRTQTIQRLFCAILFALQYSCNSYISNNNKIIKYFCRYKCNKMYVK